MRWTMVVWLSEPPTKRMHLLGVAQDLRPRGSGRWRHLASSLRSSSLPWTTAARRRCDSGGENAGLRSAHERIPHLVEETRRLMRNSPKSASRAAMRTARTTTALLVALAAARAAQAERVSIEHDAASPQASYAARRLGEALREGGHEVRLRSLARRASRFGSRSGLGGEGAARGRAAEALRRHGGGVGEAPRLECAPCTGGHVRRARPHRLRHGARPPLLEAFLNMVENRFNQLWTLHPFT